MTHLVSGHNVSYWRIMAWPQPFPLVAAWLLGCARGPVTTAGGQPSQPNEPAMRRQSQPDQPSLVGSGFGWSQAGLALASITTKYKVLAILASGKGRGRKVIDFTSNTGPTNGRAKKIWGTGEGKESQALPDVICFFSFELKYHMRERMEEMGGTGKTEHSFEP